MANQTRQPFSRRQALHVLGLDGTGELWPAEVGAVRLERGSVCVSLSDRQSQRRTTAP